MRLTYVLTASAGPGSRENVANHLILVGFVWIKDIRGWSLLSLLLDTGYALCLMVAR